MRSALVAVVTVLAVGAVACAGTNATGSVGNTPRDGVEKPTDPTAATGGGAPSSDEEPASGDNVDPAADSWRFQARAVGGGTVDGTDYAGAKTVLWVWAPWCPQCNREAPNVRAAVERFGEDLAIVGIAGKDTDAEHEEFVATHDLDSIPHAIDEDGSLWAKYGVGYQPAWVFIAEDGTTRVVAGGLYDDLEATLEDFLDS